jgi:photosystem II stability/assembly factor-like uncharacterized protein
MFVISTLMAFAVIAAAPPDWIVAQGTGGCSSSDVDFSDSRHGIVSCAFSDAMKTSDGGLTWSVFPTGLQQSLVFAHAASTTDLYLARLGLYRSTNAGATWSEVGNLSTNFGSVFDVHFEGSRLVALQGGNVLVSSNSGASWQTAFPAQTDVYLDELHFPTTTTGYASGGITTEQGSIGSILRTTDAGAHWTQLTFTHGQITATDFRDASHGVATTLFSVVYATADAGASWQVLATLPDSAYVTDLAHRSDTHWYAVATNGCIYETLDAGSRWVASTCDPASRALAALAFAGGAAIAVGNDGLVLSENRILSAGFESSP